MEKTLLTTTLAHDIVKANIASLGKDNLTDTEYSELENLYFLKLKETHNII